MKDRDIIEKLEEIKETLESPGLQGLGAEYIIGKLLEAADYSTGYQDGLSYLKGALAAQAEINGEGK